MNAKQLAKHIAAWLKNNKHRDTIKLSFTVTEWEIIVEALKKA